MAVLAIEGEEADELVPVVMHYTSTNNTPSRHTNHGQRAEALVVFRTMSSSASASK